jgi:Gpi18-like mannosyltransferase
MCKWDCKWYLTIIEKGYDHHIRTYPHVWKGLANWAFFPLYPYIVKFLHLFIKINPIEIGIIVNQFFVFFSLVTFYKYLKIHVDEKNSRFGVVLLAFSPFSIYFSSLYTEVLFLLLSLLSFYYMYTNNILLSSLFGGLLSATRPVGIMFAPIFFLNFFNKYKYKYYFYLLLILSGLGLLIYSLYLHHLSGDYLAFMHIQKGWGRTGFNGNFIYKLRSMVINDYINTSIFLLSVGLSIFLLVKKFWREALFNLFCILPGAITGTMLSEGRFCGTLFTFYFALVLLLKRSTSLKIILLISFVVMYISYILYWFAKAKFLI